MTHDTILDRARAVGPAFTDHADEAERTGTLPRAAVDAALQANLFHAIVPIELGGLGANATTAIEMLEILSEADGSAGWSVMANSLMTAVAAAFCGDGALDAIFGQDAPAVFAGMPGPGGKASRVQGGIQGSGNYSFASGSGHANWLTGGMLILDESGNPALLPSGEPEVQVVMVPRERCELTGNWDVMGLCGTGSYDFAIGDQLIGDDYTFERTSTERQRGGPIFDIGLAGWSCVGHGGVALGITARALREIAELAMTKRRPGYPGPVGDHDLFLHDFAHHEASYLASRLYLLDTFATAEAVLDAGGELTDEHRQRFRQALTYTHKVGADVVRWCYQWSGSAGLRLPHALGRCMRDINVATQHMYLDPTSYINAGSVIRDSWRTLPDAS